MQLMLLAPSEGPVYLEGRLVLSLSFQGSEPVLSPIVDDDMVVANYRIWDDATESWYADGLAVLRFADADVVMRLEPDTEPVWVGDLDVSKRIIVQPDLDEVGFEANRNLDLRWKRVG